MDKNLKIALLVGAAVVLGGSTLAVAHMDGPPPPDGPMQGLLHRGKLSERLLAEFDTNHDGKITRAEFNNVLGTRFAAATHGGSGMTEDQFVAIHQGDFEKHAAEMFRRIDWNGDGRLTLDEFAAPQRAHFQMMDRDGTGTVSCNPVMHADFHPAGTPPPDAPPAGGGDHGGWQPRGQHAGWHGGRGGHGFGGHGFGGRGGGFGRARFCGDADVSRDGNVTRAEFDGIMAKHFQSATGGGATMTLAQFTADQAVHYREMNDKMFKRLDKDGDGKLSMAEFSAPPLKMFARLDRDNDGVITADEMKPHFHGQGRGGWGHGRHDGDRGDNRPPPSGDE
ncbi:MAG TPA: EF-hand domain-containing protein [Rhizomicrobium sp.]|jgi:Ca2+-binding EF-hand superfamily protein|nr:EF-hand domain-containing protein [Rhizomicrobium sp.]